MADGLRRSDDHLPPGASGGDVRTDRSLVEAWTQRWAAAPDRIVLRDIEGTALRADELEARTAAAAGRLAAAGVGPGDRVLLSAPTSLDLVVAHVAILRLGATTVPVNPAHTQREVAHVAADASVAAALVDDEQRGRAMGEARPGCVVAGVDLAGLPTAATHPRLDRTAPGDAALLVYTSGTTGAPKGVPLSHANLLASADAVRLAWRWTEDDHLVLALPLFHVHGLGVGLHGTLTAGAAATLHPGFDADAVLAAVAAGASLCFGVPTMWARLVRAPGAASLARLRLGVSGSAPLAPDLHRAVAEVAGRPPLERYGMSETAMLVSNPYDGERRAGSVGFPLPGVEVRLGERDEIEVRGPNVFAGYLDRPDATAGSFHGDWFRTGDVGAVDDGYLRIVGRTKELIISGGFNVYPREVEDVLTSHPGVAEAAVVGVPDPEWGERVCAVVVAADPLDADGLERWCAERLAPYKRPRRWERTDVLPRNAIGKVDRRALTEQLRP